MKKITFSVSNFLFLVFISAIGHAQDLNVASGGDATGGGGSVSYSVGQMVYTAIGSAGSMTQGVQQPFEISGALGIEDHLISVNLLAYPNPTSDYLNIKVTNMDYNNISYKLFDLNGRLLANRKLENSSNQIRMTQLPSALYFLKIFDNQQLVRVFKIIKTQ